MRLKVLTLHAAINVCSDTKSFKKRFGAYNWNRRDGRAYPSYKANKKGMRWEHGRLVPRLPQ